MNVRAPFEVHNVAFFLEKLTDEFFVFGLRAFEDLLSTRQPIDICISSLVHTIPPYKDQAEQA